MSLPLLLACAVTAGTQDQATLLQHALHAHKSGQLDEAVRLYQAVVAAVGEEQCPAPVFSNLAAAHRALGRVESAESAWLKAIAVVPTHAESHHNLAISLQDHTNLTTERLEAAVHHATRAIALRPGYFKSYHALGNALQSLRKWEDAAAAFKHAEHLAGSEPLRPQLPGVWTVADQVDAASPGDVLQRGGLTLTVLSKAPKVVEVHSFLKPEECESVIEAAKPKLQASHVIGGEASIRHSETAWVPRHGLGKLVSRAAALLGIDEQLAAVEDLQASVHPRMP